MTSTPQRPSHFGDGLIDALHVDGPAPDRAEQLGLFGQFVGSWQLDWSGFDTQGRALERRGELHVGWVLGGRAIQDIWIVPGRGMEGEGQPPLAFHGTTIRFYDPSIGAWRSTWIEPVNHRVRRFIGRPDDSGIVLVSDDDEPWLRWRFRNIERHSFRWRAEDSDNHGAHWRFVEEMVATRTDEATG
jgi:hypothetical protein